MKKVLIVVLIAVVAYVAAAIVAWRLLPERIADAEGRLYGVRVALAQLGKDQWIVSERLKAITSATLGKGGNKIDEVSAILADPDLNHIALTYMGADWALQRSAFLGQVAHAHKLLTVQKEARDKTKSRLNEKVEELEARKQSLRRKLQANHPEFHIELDDIERQLVAYRRINTQREYIDRDEEDKKHIEADAKNEDNIFKLATSYQEQTVGALNRIMAERLAYLREQENLPSQIRQTASYFNVWPLNLIMKMPLEK